MSQPSSSSPRIRELFDRAVALTGPEREAFVNKVAARNAAAAAELRGLLERVTQAAPEIVVRGVHSAVTSGAKGAPETSTGDLFRRGGGALGKGFNLLDAMKGAAEEPPPQRVGNYRILRRLGEGGYGVVYLAEQASPKREVALKLIQPMLDARARRRFADEARMLGRLQHPGIAQIHEAGLADVDGRERPFFAMEFIRGQPLDKYLGTALLDTRRRLQLLAAICHAVHHAHQKQIIHRDLSPKNILVDEAGQPKVIDFGIARLMDPDPPDPPDPQRATRQTQRGDVFGTLHYMSPEQVAGDVDEVDTTSDVYALGVIGYEMLAGRLPYDLSGNAVSAAKTIRESEPARLGAVSRVFRGDIETIFEKALSKEKSRRYSSAAALAADIERYLADEPIEARKPSAWYQAKRFARKRKGVVAGAIIGAVSLVAIGATVAWAVESGRTQRLALDQSRRQARQAEVALLSQQVRRSLSAEMLPLVDRYLADSRDDEIELRLLRVELLDGLNRFKEARDEVAGLRERADLGSYRAQVLLWHGDINLTSAIETAGAPDAIASIQEAIALGLPDSEYLYAKALVAGDVNACRSQLQLATNANPTHLRAQNLLAFLDFVCGDAPGALARARAMEALAPQHPNPLIVQAIALTFMDRAKEREPVVRRLRSLLDSGGFGKADQYFALADSVVELNKLGRPTQGLQLLIAKVAPFVMGTVAAAGSATGEQEVYLRMPGFMSTEFSVKGLIAEMMPIALGKRDPAVLRAFLDKLRRLGPAVESLIDARNMREASDRRDFETAIRMAPAILEAPQLLNINADVVTTYFFALHQAWVADPTQTKRERAIAAIPTLNRYWMPYSESSAQIGMCLAELGFIDEGRGKLAELAHAFSDDEQALHGIRYWQARVESVSESPQATITACSRYLDHAAADDPHRAEVQAWLLGALKSVGRLPQRDGRDQTEDEIRARYGLSAQ